MLLAVLQKRRRPSALLILISLACGLASMDAHAQRGRARRPRAIASTTNAPTKTSMSVRTEPNATIWLDEVKRGVADATGQLTIAKVSAGGHTLRVRARGFGERVVNVSPSQRGRISVPLIRTDDEAELTFQQAEEAREKATDEAARRRASELYRRALNSRPRFPAAHVGLARVLLELSQFDDALAQINAARASRPIYPEASAVEGRVFRTENDTDAAIKSFQRAIREARGFQPEAYTGLGLVYEDEGKYEEAAAAFRKAIAQLNDTEPALYQLLGADYERLEKYKEAVAAYEKYLQLAPDGKLAPAIRSIIDQLRQQSAGDIPLPKP